MAKAKAKAGDGHVPGQVDLLSLAQARRMAGDLASLPCPACRCRQTEEIDRDVWDCLDCGHEFRAETEARQ